MPFMQWPEVSEPLPACLSYLAAASAAASAGEWLQCISHLVALQRMTALEAACHAAVAALTGFAAAAGARSSSGSQGVSGAGSRAHQRGSDALLTSTGSAASRHCAATAASPSLSPSTHTTTQLHNAYCKVLSSASSASDGRMRTGGGNAANSLVRQSLMLEDSCGILSSAMQTSGFEITFPVVDDMMSHVAHTPAPSRGTNSTSAAMMKTDEDLSLLNYEIMDTSASSRFQALSSVDAQCMGSMKASPRKPGEGGPIRVQGGSELQAAATAAASASDAVLGALARAVDEGLPQRAGVGAGPMQVHVSLLCTCTTLPTGGAANTLPGDPNRSPPVIVHISPAAQPSASEAALAAVGCNAWGAAPGVPEPSARAFDAETYQSPDCMHGVRRALADALHCAKGAAGCPDTVWHGAADKLRPEALCVVSAKNVSPHALQSSDSGAPPT